MNRILFLDYARTIALFLVVFAHLYSSDSAVKLYIYAFHMPFFFIASGFLHKDENLKNLVNKLLKRLLIPFFIFLFIGYLFYTVYTRSLALGIALGSLKGILLGKSIVANDILWFLIVLFFVRIIGEVFIRKPFPSLLLWGVFFVVFNFFKLNILYFGTTIMALPFYLFGHYARGYTLRIVNNKWSLLFSLLLLCITLLMSHYNGKVSMMGMNYGKYDMVALRILFFYINGIIGSYMLMCVASGIKQEIQWLLLPSRCALSIVGLQVIPIMIWYRIIGFNQNYLLSFVYSVLIIIICILFHLHIRRKFPWIVGSK